MLKRVYNVLIVNKISGGYTLDSYDQGREGNPPPLTTYPQEVVSWNYFSENI